MSFAQQAVFVTPMFILFLITSELSLFCCFNFPGVSRSLALNFFSLLNPNKRSRFFEVLIGVFEHLLFGNLGSSEGCPARLTT